MSKKLRQRAFEVFFWLGVGAGVAVAMAILYLGWLLYTGNFHFTQLPEEAGELRGHASVALATVALALFTCFLWLAAAITARFARKEIATTTTVHSADLTLQLDNRFHSDRALRIRHGAVMFLAKKRDLEIPCDHDLSPVRLDEEHLWYGLSSDLIDLFNFYDWIGYLTSEDSNAIDREVVRRKIGPWIVNYCRMCMDEIKRVQGKHPDRWEYLVPFYEDLLKKQEKWYKKHKKTPPAGDKEEELNAFLLREHVRSHRGFAASIVNIEST